MPDDPVAKATQTLNQLLDDFGDPDTELNIDKDEATGRFVYQFIDRETGEITHQFPPEEVLVRLAAVRSIEGLIFDDEV